MPLSAVRSVLIADAGVTALVSAANIVPLEQAQGAAWPCIVLSVAGGEPINGIEQFEGLDLMHVNLDVWAFNYTAALNAANACRTALQAAGHLCAGRQSDEFVFDKDPGAFRVGYMFNVWI